jgi:hypothetical protein
MSKFSFQAHHESQCWGNDVGIQRCEPCYSCMVQEPIFYPSNPEVKWINEGCWNSNGDGIGYNGRWKDLQQFNFHEKHVA